MAGLKIIIGLIGAAFLGDYIGGRLGETLATLCVIVVLWDVGRSL